MKPRTVFVYGVSHAKFENVISTSQTDAIQRVLKAFEEPGEFYGIFGHEKRIESREGELVCEGAQYAEQITSFLVDEPIKDDPGYKASCDYEADGITLYEPERHELEKQIDIRSLVLTLRDLVRTTEAAGGLTRTRKRMFAPVGDPDWLDLGEVARIAYNTLQLLPEKYREPLTVREEHTDDE